MNLASFSLKRFKWVLYVVGISLFVYLILESQYLKYQVNTYGRYTEGTVTEITTGTRGHTYVNYTYEVDFKKFKGKTGFYSRPYPKLGDILPVKYSYKNPSLSLMEIE